MTSSFIAAFDHAVVHPLPPSQKSISMYIRMTRTQLERVLNRQVEKEDVIPYYKQVDAKSIKPTVKTVALIQKPTPPVALSDKATVGPTTQSG